MRVSTTLALMIALTLGCYRDVAAPSAGLTTVLLTPENPGDVVERIVVYVTEIAASTDDDVGTASEWTVMARPRTNVQLDLAHDPVPVPLGGGLLQVDAYSLFRVSILGDSSGIELRDGHQAKVRWPSAGEFALFAIADTPIAVSPDGVEIVIMLDGTASFSTLIADPLHDILFTPVARATPVVAGSPGLPGAHAHATASPLPLNVVPLEAP
jgi:hypothetical protein